MFFVKGGPAVPERLIHLVADGKAVFFCGAGISYPAGLVDFKGLTEGLFAAAGGVKSDVENVALAEKRYDLAIDLLEHRLGPPYEFVRRTAHAKLQIDLTRPNAIATHEALLKLATSRADRACRLVTTNFDLGFEEARDPGVRTYLAPLLPPPKKSMWNGIAYIHGLLPESADDKHALNQLVLSSGDFGRAYLTERWASSFVSELFTRFSVCFVGYSIDDPVLRYMMDALSADRVRGETVNEMFAFGACAPGSEPQETVRWKAKGVTPILFDPAGGYSNLHDTLRRWGTMHSAGLTQRAEMIQLLAPYAPSSVDGDPDADTVLWGIADLSGVGARTFADIVPPPPIEWLEVFKSPRFEARDLRLFGATPAKFADPEAPEEQPFSILARPVSSRFAPYVSPLHQSADRHFVHLDLIHRHLCRWLSHHLDKPQLISWVIRGGGNLHDHFRYEVENRLKDKDCVLPDPVRKVWAVLCSTSMDSSRNSVFRIADLVERAKTGWTPSMKAELIHLLEPRVRLNPPSARMMLPAATTPPTAVRDFVSHEIVLNGDHIGQWLDQLAETFGYRALLLDLLPTLTQHIYRALGLMSELESAGPLFDKSYADLPSISAHDQNNNQEEWPRLVTLCRDAWLIAVAQNRPVAIAEYECWKRQPYPIFKRLSLFALVNDPGLSADDGVDILLADGAYWLWASGIMRERSRYLVERGAALSPAAFERLCPEILKGPALIPDEDENISRTRAEHRTWRILAKLQSGGAALPAACAARLAELSAAHPGWELAANQSDEFPVYITVGEAADWFNDQATPLERKPEALADWLEAHGTTENDDWAAICHEAPEVAIAALSLLAKRGYWNADVWTPGLQAFQNGNSAELSWRELAPEIVGAPKEFIQAAVYPLAWWVRQWTHLAADPGALEISLAKRVLADAPAVDAAGDDEPETTSLNHPAGLAFDAIMKCWYGTEPKTGATLQEPFLTLFTEAAASADRKFLPAQLYLSQSLAALFQVDPDWTQQHLFPLFDWQLHPADALWRWDGFFLRAQGSLPLMQAFKPLYLSAAPYYDQLGIGKQLFPKMLVHFALSFPGLYSPQEVSTALGILPVDGIAHAANALANLAATTPLPKEQFWTERVRPLFEASWPKGAGYRSENEASELALVLVRAGDKFGEAIEVASLLLSRTNHMHMIALELDRSGMGGRFPEATLRLLDAVIDDQHPFVDPLLRVILNLVVNTQPALAQDARYARISDYLTRFQR